MTGGHEPSSKPRDDSLPGRAVIEMIQAAFRAGDYAGIAARYDDDLDWLVYGPPSVFPEVGHKRGKTAVFQALHTLNRNYQLVRYLTEWLIAEGDRVASISDVSLKQRATGRTIRFRMASFHRVRDGRVIEYRGFLDSFDAAEQVLGHELPV